MSDQSDIIEHAFDANAVSPEVLHRSDDASVVTAIAEWTRIECCRGGTGQGPSRPIFEQHICCWPCGPR